MEGLSNNTVSQRYAVPLEAPTYRSNPQKIIAEKKRSLSEILEFVFVVVAFGLTLWLAWLLLLKGTDWAWSMVGWLIAFWALMAYVALPRMHQFFTALYVPDYFIARTKTGDGLLGDPVNLAFDGTAEDIHAAMRKAGWVKADEITVGSSWGIIKSSILRKSYPQAPVSDLFLFGRRHAFAYQQEVDGNASQRHHIRFWPVPDGWVLPGGHRVGWLAAGTYDRSVGLSIFTGQITHKIDADIDVERDYVIDTVRFADPQCSVRVIEDFSTAYHHRNGGGDMVRTDGDLPVLNVAGAAERSDDCSVADSRDCDSLGDPLPPSTPYDAVNAQIDHAKKRHIPPLPFLMTGLIVLLAVVVVVATWALVLFAPGFDVTESFPSLVEFAWMSIVIMCLSLTWIMTAKRSRHARLLLISLVTIETVRDFLSATADGDLHASGLISAALALLMLWSVTGESMKRWVTTDGKS